MTDADIIKAWECIAYHKECSESEECPYYMDNYNMCDNISLAKDVLDIYNRQKATIERLRGRLDSLNKQAEEMKKGNARLYLRFNTAKNKAIKEFAERLKEEATTVISCNTWREVVRKSDIDNLVKEMAGDTE